MRVGSNPGGRRRYKVSLMGEYKILTSMVEMDNDSAAVILMRILVLLLEALSANLFKNVLES